MKRLPFAYSFSMPDFSSQSLDYKVMAGQADVNHFDDKARERIYRALDEFVALYWGGPPKSEHVKTSLLKISSAAIVAADAIKKLADTYSAGNPAAHMMLCDETELPMEDYHALFEQSMKLRVISQCAEKVMKKVPKLPRGNPGKHEFHGLVFALHDISLSAGGAGWFTVKADDNPDSDAGTVPDKYIFKGAFVYFVCAALRQAKPFLRGAPISCWPAGVDVKTDAIIDAERDAIGRAIKAARMSMKQGQEIP
jgi:hypothetical protein